MNVNHFSGIQCCSCSKQSRSYQSSRTGLMDFLLKRHCECNEWTVNENVTVTASLCVLVYGHIDQSNKSGKNI